mmetsp:Transcript_25519/g.55841  ORF Transcript_25519/g.55841 Transcript_25519/m.55841 type:complete len:265 (+) Transcript_25519:110-904(+)
MLNAATAIRDRFGAMRKSDVTMLVSLALRASSFILLLTALPRSLQSIQRCRCRRGASRRNCGRGDRRRGGGARSASGLQLRGAGSAGLWQQTRHGRRRHGRRERRCLGPRLGGWRLRAGGLGGLGLGRGLRSLGGGRGLHGGHALLVQSSQSQLRLHRLGQVGGGRLRGRSRGEGIHAVARAVGSGHVGIQVLVVGIPSLATVTVSGCGKLHLRHCLHICCGLHGMRRRHTAGCSTRTSLLLQHGHVGTGAATLPGCRHGGRHG